MFFEYSNISRFGKPRRSIVQQKYEWYLSEHPNFAFNEPASRDINCRSNTALDETMFDSLLPFINMKLTNSSISRNFI